MNGVRLGAHRLIRINAVRLLLTAVLLIPAFGGSSLAYVCEMSGEIHGKCCCHHDAPSPSDCAELAKRSCCDVRSTGSARIAKSTRPVPNDQLPAPAALHFTMAGPEPTAACPRPVESPDFTANAPPIFLRNCSLLR